MDVNDILGAEAVLGLAWSAQERAQMAGSLADQVELARAGRALRWDNHAQTAHVFDPRLPGFDVPPDGEVHLPPTDRPLPDTDTDIAFAPVRDLSSWIASGALTSQRLTQIYLDRIETLNPKLSAWAQVMPERALAEAAAADAELVAGVYLGPLHGIPYGLKDLFDAKGTVTGWGPSRGRTASRNRMPLWSRACGRRGRCSWAKPARARLPMAMCGMAARRATHGT